ncbi:SDR family oxidoreductase [soil metagenome]
MNLDLTGKRALICGSSGGIGLACAAELAGLGAQCILLARDEGKLAAALRTLPPVGGLGGRGHVRIVADLANPEGVRDAVAGHLRGESAGSGAGAVHIVINNTGGPPAGSALEAKPEDLLKAFSAQLIAAQMLAQLLAPGMKAAGYGRIINITSTSVKQPIPNLGISNIVRPAVAAWAKCLATELGGFGITANNILPGFTSTERLSALMSGRAKTQQRSQSEVEAEVMATIPAGRFAAPREVAAVVAFLCTPAAAYVNGINVPVDGGRLGGL